MPDFNAANLRGETIEVKYKGEGPKRILLYFTPTCPYCREQFAYWREIIERADPNQFEVLGVARNAEDKSKLEALPSLGQLFSRFTDAFTHCSHSRSGATRL